jgi:hypothetical protein
MTSDPLGADYHAAHLAFSRAAIVTNCAMGKPILDLLKKYTDDVVAAEREAFHEYVREYGRLGYDGPHLDHFLATYADGGDRP